MIKTVKVNDGENFNQEPEMTDEELNDLINRPF